MCNLAESINQMNLNVNCDILEESINRMNKISLNEKPLFNFIHSKNAILNAGEFKGYNCFVTDITPICVEVKMEEIAYEFVRENEIKKIGENIGKAVILDIIPEMYEIYDIKKKMNIRLPCEAFTVMIVLKNGNLLNKNGEKYYYVKNIKNENIVETDFEIEKSKESVSFLEEEILDVYAMVVDRKYTEFYGNYGYLLKNIGKQYQVLYSNFIIFKKTSVKKLKDDNVLIKTGTYKNKIGKLVKVYENNYTITLNANGKKLHEIFVKEENGYVSKKIVKENLFNIDIVLKSGNYFQVNEIISENVFRGTERNGNKYIDRNVTLDEIRDIDLRIFSKETKEMEEMEEKEEEKEEKEILDDTLEEKEILDDTLEEKEEILEDDIDDEKEIDQYDDQYDDKNDVENNDIVIVGDPEMKSTFKDSGRLNSMEKRLSDKENDILKIIEKCKKSLEYDTENTYTIIDKVNECVDLFKNDLLKTTKVKVNTDLVKKSDYTFVVTLLLLYDLVKSGFTMQKSFDSYIEKLYNEGYIKGTYISGSIFLRKDKNDMSNSIFSSIQMTDSEYNTTKELLKKKNHLSVLKIIVKNCDKLLQNMYGKVTFNYDNKIEYIPIIRKDKYDYPKYFLTSKDLVSNNISSDAKNILKGPLIRKWINGLMEKEKNINNEKKREIYRFIINNFTKAPIILKSVDIKSDMKYIEFERVYNKYLLKLDNHLKEMDNNRKRKIDSNNDFRIDIISKRSKI